MTSVERVMEYSNLPLEAPLESEPDHKPPPDWPQKGVINCEGTSFRYSENSPPVIHNLHVTIQAEEKVH